MATTATEFNAVQCPIFQDMNEDELATVLRLFAHESFPAGETILREGNAIQILWIIVHGRCEVVKQTRNGQQQRLAEFGPGHVFGEMSFFQPAPHSASIRTLTEVEVMRLSRQDYDKLATTASTAAFKIAYSLASVLAERLRITDEWMREIFEAEVEPTPAKRKEWHDFRAKLYSEWEF